MLDSWNRFLGFIHVGIATLLQLTPECYYRLFLHNSKKSVTKERTRYLVFSHWYLDLTLYINIYWCKYFMQNLFFKKNESTGSSQLTTIRLATAWSYNGAEISDSQPVVTVRIARHPWQFHDQNLGAWQLAGIYNSCSIVGVTWDLSSQPPTSKVIGESRFT